MDSDECYSPFAFNAPAPAPAPAQAPTGDWPYAWLVVTIDPDQPIVWSTWTVPAAAAAPVEFEVSYVLTGPGCGGERHWFAVTQL